MKKSEWRKKGTRYGNPILYKNYYGNFQVKNIDKYVEEMRKKFIENGHKGEIAINMLVNKEENSWRKVVPFQDMKNKINLNNKWFDEYFGVDDSVGDKIKGFEIYVTKK